MNSEFRIDIRQTRSCAEKLDELKRCAQELVWRLDEARSMEMNDPYPFSVCSQEAEKLTRYFGNLTIVLQDISNDAQWTGEKISTILEEYSYYNAQDY